MGDAAIQNINSRDEKVLESGRVVATTTSNAAPPPDPAQTTSTTTTNITSDLASQIEADARLVYNYHRMHMPLPSSSSTPVDAVFCLCSLDVRVARHAASVFLSLSPSPRHLIFSGGSGVLTADRFSKPEAQVFADVAVREMGVPVERVIVEGESTNTGENVRFTRTLLRRRGLLGGIKRMVLVQKPYMERRTFATFVRQWVDEDGGGEGGKGEGDEVEFTVTSPRLEWDGYPDAENPRELVINVMVGDLVRIREYPAKGYQIPMEIPDEVWQAGRRLVELGGFGGHLPS